jgi:hypothetical protein
MAAMDEARPSPPIQGMAAGSWAAEYVVRVPDIRTFFSFQEGEQRRIFLLRDLRASRHFNVSRKIRHGLRSFTKQSQTGFRYHLLVHMDKSFTSA